MKDVFTNFRLRDRILTVAMFITAITLMFVASFLFSKNIVSENPNVISNIETKPVSLVDINSKLLFTGNIYLSRYINDWAMASSLKYAYPFSRLNEFDRSSYNAWIAGLECPMKSNFYQTSAEEDATLSFNCSPDYLPELKKWFNVVTLANNHTDNRGAEGFAETKQNLESARIQYFGHYDPRVLDDVCEVIAVPFSLKYDDDSSKTGNIPIAMCGWNGVFRIPPDASAEVMQKYAKIMPVIAMPHMGKEYVSSIDEIKSTFYHKLIDNGADMVLGDHPHWVQPSESYKGHLIVYSMGNFMFDQQSNSEVTRSAAIKVVIQNDDNDIELLNKWLKLGDSCLKFKDSCYEDAINSGLPKLKLNFKFEAVGSDDSSKITHRASDAVQNSILNRLNWWDTMSKLEKPYQKL